MNSPWQQPRKALPQIPNRIRAQDGFYPKLSGGNFTFQVISKPKQRMNMTLKISWKSFRKLHQKMLSKLSNKCQKQNSIFFNIWSKLPSTCDDQLLAAITFFASNLPGIVWKVQGIKTNWIKNLIWQSVYSN